MPLAMERVTRRPASFPEEPSAGSVMPARRGWPWTTWLSRTMRPLWLTVAPCAGGIMYCVMRSLGQPAVSKRAK